MKMEPRSKHRHTVRSFINDSPSVVYESLLGNALTNKSLVVLEGHSIIMRRDYKSLKGKVKIIGGGGAGIEPAEAFYVGKGMLTAAVVGEVYSAPAASEIFTAIKELCEDQADEVLLLVKNYLGDKLNFRLAMEQAWSENKMVKMLIIGDDVFPHLPTRHGRKGMAGSTLVYKILGEMAEEGKLLDELIEHYKKFISDNLATVSVMLTPCTHKTCCYFNTTIDQQEMILGMGVYGQGGYKKVGKTNLKSTVSLILEEIISYLKITPDNKIVVLVNNCGALTKLEETVIAKEVSMQLCELGFSAVQFYAGTFMTSLGSQGFSVSILNVYTEEVVKILNIPTTALGWPSASLECLAEFNHPDLPVSILPSTGYVEVPKFASSTEQVGPILSEKAVAAMKQIVLFAAEALISCEVQLNVIDTEAGDGDAGTMLRKAAEEIRENLLSDRLNLKEPYKLLLELSEIFSNQSGLTGALYSVFFRSAAKVFEKEQGITPELCCKAFKEAVQAIKCYGNAELLDRTVIDALCPAVEAFESAIGRGKGLTEAALSAAVMCEVKSEETKRMKPPSMTHTNVRLPLIYADAGTHAASIWLRAVSEGLRANLRWEQRVVSALLGTVYYTHVYFTASRWRTAADVYFYIRESILRQSVESPPVSLEIFEPEEAKAVLIFFLENYIRNLPLVSILHLPHYKLHLSLTEDKTDERSPKRGEKFQLV